VLQRKKRNETQWSINLKERDHLVDVGVNENVKKYRRRGAGCRRIYRTGLA
jgi:hypothetical protein